MLLKITKCNHIIRRITVGLLFIFLVTTGFSQAPFSNVIIFGDSLSDGFGSYANNQNFSANGYWAVVEGVGHTKQTAGVPVTSSTHGSRDGRKVWVNYLIPKIAQSPTIYNYWDAINPKLKVNYETANINFAFIAAQTANTYVNNYHPTHLSPTALFKVEPRCKKPGLFIHNHQQLDSPENYACVPGLLKQISSFYLPKIQTIQHRTAFFILAGSNDLLQIAYKIQNDHTLSGILKQFEASVTHQVQAVRLLIAHGANTQNIYLISLMSAADTPEYNQMSSIKRRLLTTVTLFYNVYLENKLSEAGIPASHILNWQHPFQQVVSEIKQHGSYIFPNSDYVFNNIGDCIADGKNTPLSNCEGYVFYNDSHPSTYMHQLLANLMYQQINESTIPKPLEDTGL